MDPIQSRYILMLLDSKHKQHDGKVFASLPDARAYAQECIQERYCDKAIVGMFVWEGQAQEMNITLVETFGFPGDKKKTAQLNLFSTTKK